MSQQEPTGVQPVLSTSHTQAPPTNGMAIASLVLGIVGLIGLPLIGPILALVFGYRARREIDASGGTQGGRGFADAGVVLGWVGIALAIVLAVLALAFFAIFINVGVERAGMLLEIEETLRP